MTEPDPRMDRSRRYSPLGQLILARMREFYREPEAVFWVYVFPLLMIIALGMAFRSRPIERFTVDVCLSSPTAVRTAGRSEADKIAERLSSQERFIISLRGQTSCFHRLRTGKTDVVVIPTDSSVTQYQYHFDSTKPGSLVARHAVDDVLQRAAGRVDPIDVEDVENRDPGGRYIDFLVPGLLGMGLMGGGLWGVGFVTVDMRIRNLLKRFVATPMKRSHFLAALMISRMSGMVPEVLLLLTFAWLVFGVVVRGSLISVTLLILMGSVMFAGIGLLVASRARTLEAVSGLMNLVMLPMWLMSGIFFSSERFPEAIQPFIKVLPLTPLIDALRAVILDGASLTSLTWQLVTMLIWTVLSFTLALKWFRWT
jgi:ABC-type multidrug transport system permease subunit